MWCLKTKRKHSFYKLTISYPRHAHVLMEVFQINGFWNTRVAMRHESVFYLGVFRFIMIIT